MIDYSKLNPGIRTVVRLLRHWGFETTDSGDGKTHEFSCDRDHPYVVCVVEHHEILIRETQRMSANLRRIGIEVKPIGSGEPCIQASWDPATGTPVIDLMDLDDEKLTTVRRCYLSPDEFEILCSASQLANGSTPRSDTPDE